MKGENQDEKSTTKPNIPLRTILRDFINLVEDYEQSRDGVVDLYEKEFQELKQFSETLKSDSYYQCKEGERTVNRKKNRYKDILPFDYSRVSLSDYGDIPGCDYVNANFIKGASGSSAYIACQGPLPHTVNDFWRMVVECEVQVIVMACMEQESGKHKCENYWVEEDGMEREFGEVTVWLKKCRNVCTDFLVRTMRIRFPNAKHEMEERNVCQFHYSAWPDHGVPTKVRPLLDMVRLIRDCQASETLPVLVHCSAGCGRTGTICAIDYVCGLLRLGKLSTDFSLFNLVREMRRQRIAMVQTKDQYILVYRAVKELFQEQLKIIEAHLYANVDHNGLPLELRQELEEPMYATIDVYSKHRSSPSSSLNLINVPSNDNNNFYSKDVPPVPNHAPSNPTLSPHNSEKTTLKPFHSTDTSNQTNIENGGIESSGEDTVDSHFPVTIVSKIPLSNTNSSRTASLLRNPSIVKLKSLFEKYPKQSKEQAMKKATVTLTGLSRAKSDVSNASRFYSFATSFSPKNSSSTSSVIPKDNPPIKSTLKEVKIISEGNYVSKPLTPVKPSLLVKRSKSLKVYPGDSDEGKQKLEKAEIQSPVKVCIQQTEIPKPQSVKTSAFKAFLFENADHVQDQYNSTHINRRESQEPLLAKSLSHNDSTESYSPPSQRLGLLQKNSRLKTENWEWKTRDEYNPPRDLIRSGHGTPLTTNDYLTQTNSEVLKKVLSNENKNDVRKIQTEAIQKSSYTHNDKDHGHEKDSTDSNFPHFINNSVTRKPFTTSITDLANPQSKIELGNSVANLINRQANGFGGMSNSNSVPSTPKPSSFKLNHEVNRSIPSKSAQPKSILKGSLSSTPSDSDEPLDTRPRTTNTTVVTISSNNSASFNNLASGSRMPLRIRERRNSFRQAVWKEAQADCANSENLTASCDEPPVIPLNHRNGLPDNPPILSSHRTHKDYEPIWPLVKQKEPENSNSNTTTSLVQARIDKFKVLLDELKEPVKPETGSGNLGSPRTSTSLKYHRSLKAPTRSDYEQIQSSTGVASSLTCFPFKKPASLESIADQLQVEKKHTSNFSGFDATKGSDVYEGNSGGRFTNDYVTLEQCRTDLPDGMRLPDRDALNISGNSVRSNNFGVIPIPPPRTKGRRRNLTPSNAFDLNVGGNVPSIGLPQTKSIEQYSNPSNPSLTGFTKTRAIGIFQDMKTKFVNWTEPSSGKEKSENSSISGTSTKLGSSSQLNGNVCMGSSDTLHENAKPRNDFRFIHSKTGDNPGGPSSRLGSKHQYL